MYKIVLNKPLSPRKYNPQSGRQYGKYYNLAQDVHAEHIRKTFSPTGKKKKKKKQAKWLSKHIS